MDKSWQPFLIAIPIAPIQSSNIITRLMWIQQQPWIVVIEEIYTTKRFASHDIFLIFYSVVGPFGAKKKWRNLVWFQSYGNFSYMSLWNKGTTPQKSYMNLLFHLEENKHLLTPLGNFPLRILKQSLSLSPISLQSDGFLQNSCIFFRWHMFLLIPILAFSLVCVPKEA